MDFHKRLTLLRKKKKLSREDLAKKLELSYSAISKYESGNRQPDYNTLREISDFFNCSIDYLLGKEQYQYNDTHSNFDPIRETNNLFIKYGVEDAGFWDIEKWKEMSPEDIRSLEDYFDYLYNKSRDKNLKSKDHKEVDDI
ncbi:helix-turn-helix transcriptional regulator [Halobacillus shinanisalinarum]|uniref:Helix-turn-helix transcriptional regulator n=2 Tax=Halobacillus TaxID=45667 RepID=A0ABY4HBL9_9BACI|nr:MULTISPECIES: helix-turn-helix transcriptional regulator [Halobacillus]UOQ94065.1 helix-turn-helix transcriptional regulator [Halobacillus shinanisalinarum]UOR12004.1 helix-turn-helix transcriptional regulator [Halobacillus amylolyticus]